MNRKTIITTTLALLIGLVIGYMIPNKTKIKTLAQTTITEGQRGQL